jgi:hypothetical protein
MKKKLSQLDIMKKVRKPMPPPSKVIIPKHLREKNKKKWIDDYE